MIMMMAHFSAGGGELSILDLVHALPFKEDNFKKDNRNKEDKNKEDINKGDKTEEDKNKEDKTEEDKNKEDKTEDRILRRDLVIKVLSALGYKENERVGPAFHRLTAAQLRRTVVDHQKLKECEIRHLLKAASKTR